MRNYVIIPEDPEDDELVPSSVERAPMIVHQPTVEDPQPNPVLDWIRGIFAIRGADDSTDDGRRMDWSPWYRDHILDDTPTPGFISPMRTPPAEEEAVITLPDPNPPGKINPLWIGASIIGVLLVIHFWPTKKK